MRALVLLLALAVAAPAAAAPQPPSVYCLSAKERKRAIWLKAGDGTRLAGVVLGSGPRGIVLTHQSDGSMCESLPHARRYARAGYRVLAIDMRGYGYSSRARRAFAYDSDVAGAARELRRRGAKKVVAVGASLGALAALTASPRAQLDGIVSLSSPAAYRGLDALAAVRSARMPILFVAARDDRNDTFDFAADAQRLHDAAAGEKSLTLVEGSAHGWEMLETSARLAVDAFVRSRVA